MSIKTKLKGAPPMDPERFDRMLDREPRLVGADCIGAVIGVSGKTVKRWHETGVVDLPVGKIGGRYTAFASELRQWLRQQTAA